MGKLFLYGINHLSPNRNILVVNSLNLWQLEGKLWWGEVEWGVGRVGGICQKGFIFNIIIFHEDKVK